VKRVVVSCASPYRCRTGCERTGTVWTPTQAAKDVLGDDAYRLATEIGLPADGEDAYTWAKTLGLTGDDPPEPGRDYVMVQLDDRPGALEVHYAENVRPQ
jgi:hypothetical protein